MLRFKAQNFVWLAFHIEKLQGESIWDTTDSAEAAKEEKEWRERVTNHLHFMGRECKALSLDASVGQCERISARAKGATEISPLCYLLRDLEATLVRELPEASVLGPSERSSRVL